MRKLFAAALLAALLAAAPALGQSSPNFAGGQVPTAAQWNSYFAAKLDYSGSYTFPGFLIIGAPTGGTPPTGYINAQGLQVNGANVLLTTSSITIGGDCSGTGGATITITCTKTNGSLLGPIATLNVGVGLVSAGGNLAITAPVTVALGGTNCIAASGTCLDNISGLSTTGILERTGAGAYGTVAGIGLIGVQTFCASGCSHTAGTYTATTGTTTNIVCVQAQGGGAGSAASTSGTQNAQGGAGGAGSYGCAYYSASQTGSTIAIGSSGAGGTAGGIGTAGSTASFCSVGGCGSGVVLSCPGGAAGAAGVAFTGATSNVGAATAQAAACTFTGVTTTLASVPGAGAPGAISLALSIEVGQSGANSLLGSGGVGIAVNVGAGAAGNAGTGNGAGGSGGVNGASQGAAVNGGNPSPGIVIVYEYKSS